MFVLLSLPGFVCDGLEVQVVVCNDSFLILASNSADTSLSSMCVVGEMTPVAVKRVHSARCTFIIDPADLIFIGVLHQCNSHPPRLTS